MWQRSQMYTQALPVGQHPAHQWAPASIPATVTGQTTQTVKFLERKITLRCIRGKLFMIYCPVFRPVFSRICPGCAEQRVGPEVFRTQTAIAMKPSLYNRKCYGKRKQSMYEWQPECV